MCIGPFAEFYGPVTLMVKEMFFRPSFCANCGDKIERADWGIFTSRRFCPVCESEFKGWDLLPRFVVAAAVLMGMVGFAAYLKSGSSVSESQLIRQPKKLVEQPVSASQISKETTANAPLPANASGSAVAENRNQVIAQKIDPRPAFQPPAKAPVETTEAMYYCGAATAKGTPCRHRVKGNVRCFQHAGMPAMLPPEQLRIK